MCIHGLGKYIHKAANQTTINFVKELLVATAGRILQKKWLLVRQEVRQW